MPLANAPLARPTRRTGLTLVELLVVVTIIAVLASLAISAVFTLRESQMKRFTETTIQKLASALDQQWLAAHDQIRQELGAPNPSSPYWQLWTWAQTIANGDPRRARVIYTKARLKQEFPVTINGAKNPINLPAVLNGKPAYTQVLGSVTSSSSTQDWESSALLYLALTQGRRGVAALNLEEVDPSAIKQQGNFKIFVDAWGYPLRYFIFPVYNTELQIALTETDPQDPEGTFQQPWSMTMQNQFAQAIHPLINGQKQRLIPVIASAGRDSQWGINPANDPNAQYMRLNNQNQANDNIYSYRLRQFGARGD